MIKRLFDFSAACIGLLIALPFMLLIALIIRLDSPGSVFFSQVRLGRGGQHFKLHKFRKFPVRTGTNGSGVTVAGDVRMTRVGKFLERSKLDELPQFFNIIKGQMSFVGPRPESLRYADLFQGEYEKVLDYLPGVFGPSQIAFRNESELYPADQDPEEYYRTVLFADKAERDLIYFKHSNWIKDIQWIIKGVWVSLLGAVNWRRMVGLHAGVLALDLTAIVAAWWVAYILRYGQLNSELVTPLSITGSWLFPAVVIPVLVIGGCYQRPVRHFDIGDAIRLLKSAAVGWGIATFIMLAFFFRNQSLLLGPLGLLISLPFMTSPRLWYRDRWFKKARKNKSRGEVKHVLLYGAGDQGSALALLIDHGLHRAKMIGFLDDNVELRGRFIRGHKVFGVERDLPAVHTLRRVDQLWISFVPEKVKLRRIQVRCEELNIKVIVIPLIEPFVKLVGPELSEHSQHKEELSLEEVESQSKRPSAIQVDLGSKLTH